MERSERNKQGNPIIIIEVFILQSSIIAYVSEKLEM